MPSLPRVLIVEDDPAIRSLLAVALGREPLFVDTAADGVAGLEKLRAGRYAVAIVDLMMPRMDGFTFLEALQTLGPLRPPMIFVMTAYDDAAVLRLDPTLVHGYFKKPFDIDALVQTIRDCATLLHLPQEQPEPEVELPQDAPRDRPVDVC